MSERAHAAGWIEPPKHQNDYLRLLVAPPRDPDVLISDEIVYYKAPKHVMSLAEPTIETFAVIILVTATLLRPQWEGLNFGALVVILSAITMWRWTKQREWGWGALVAGVVLGYIVLTNDFDPLTLVPLVGLLFIGRLGIKILRWWKYEIRYLTNRRIIEATGFFGLRVASMPVSHVTDLVLTRTSGGELFGYGDLRIESAGQDQSLAQIPWLVEPRAFHRLAVRLATKPSEITPKDFIELRPVRQVERRT
jgi:hypothetical protein